MGLLEGKRALITGVASERSIAWAIAEALQRQGADLVFTVKDRRLAARVATLGDVAPHRVLCCDLSDDTEIARSAEALAGIWDGVDILVHSVAFAPSGQLKGDFLACVDREGFRMAHDISAYSFVALAKALRPLLSPGASLLTLSHLGAVRAIPNYNVMGPAKASLEATVRYMAASLGPSGQRVNAISAGPVKTLAAKGIAEFDDFLDYAARNAPLRRNVTPAEIANSAAFLCSDLASGITGEVLYVDAGYHVTAVGA